MAGEYGVTEDNNRQPTRSEGQKLLSDANNAAEHLLVWVYQPQYVPSANAGTEVLDRRTEGFVVNFLSQKLRTMPEEEFNIKKEELAKDKSKALTTLTQVSIRYWGTCVGVHALYSAV